MRSMGRRITFGAISLVFLWAGSAQASPKNVIIMIGDGMGLEQVESARLLDPDAELVMDEMDPDPAFAITLNVYGEITDSAASATALATGQKSYNGAISVDVDFGDTLMHVSGNVMKDNVAEQVKPFKTTRYIAPKT
jgi:alkaline phosphatase